MKAIMKRAALLMAIPLFAGVFAAGLGTFYAQADEVGEEIDNVKMGDIPYRTWYYEYGTIESTGFDYRATVGPFNADAADYGLKPFDTKESANLVTQSDNPAAKFENWRWIFQGSTFVLEFHIKQDGVLSFEYPEGSLNNSCYMQGWTMIHSLYQKTGDSLNTLVHYFHQTDSVSGKSLSVAAKLGLDEIRETLTRSVEVKAGDVIYYEVGGTGTENLQSMTSARVVLRETSASEPEEEDVDLSASLAFGDIPSMTQHNDFGAVEQGYVTYQALAGRFNPDGGQNYGLTPFDTKDSENKVSLSSKSGLFFENWQWKFVYDTSIVFKFEAHITGNISFHFSALGVGWMEKDVLIFNVYRVSKAGVLETLVKYDKGADTAGNGAAYDGDVATLNTVFSRTFNVQDGDTLYYEIGALGGEVGAERNLQNMQQDTIVFAPTAINDVVIQTVTKSLEDQVAALKQSDYATEDWEAITGHLNTFKAGQYDTLGALYKAYTQTKAAIEAIKPDTLADMKTRLSGKLEEYYDGLNEEYYTEENWADIEEAYQTFLNGYQAAKDSAALQELYDTALAAMKAVKAYKQEFNYLDYPSTMNANGYAWIEGDVFDTKLFTGTVEDGLLEFDAQGSTKHIMYNTSLNPGLTAGGKPAYYAENWVWYIGDGASVIVAYRAKADCRITIDCKREASAKTDPSRAWGWTEDTQYIIWIVRDGVAKKISSVNAPTTDAQISGDWYLKEGDILYFEYAAPLVTAPRNFQSPCDTIGYGDSTAFNQAKYDEQNHDLSEEVLAKIEECTEQLQAYYAGLNNDDYSATNWEQFQQYIDAFIEQCETDVDTVEDVEALYNSTLESMKKIQTKAQAAEELVGVKEGLVKELEEEYNKLLAANDYTEENKAKLDAALEEGKTKIGAATTRSAANNAKLDAVRALNAVEGTPKSGGGDGGEKTGCGSVVASGALTLLCAAGAAVLFLKKKRS